MLLLHVLQMDRNRHSSLSPATTTSGSPWLSNWKLHPMALAPLVYPLLPLPSKPKAQPQHQRYQIYSLSSPKSVSCIANSLFFHPKSQSREMSSWVSLTCLVVCILLCSLYPGPNLRHRRKEHETRIYMATTLPSTPLTLMPELL